MAIYTGTRKLPQERMSITNGRDIIMFDRPYDLLLYMERRPELVDEIKFGAWVWTSEQVDDSAQVKTEVV